LGVWSGGREGVKTLKKELKSPKEEKKKLFQILIKAGDPYLLSLFRKRVRFATDKRGDSPLLLLLKFEEKTRRFGGEERGDGHITIPPKIGGEKKRRHVL